MSIKLWTVGSRRTAESWRPTFDEREQLFKDRELLNTPIGDIAEGDIVLDTHFSVVKHNNISRLHGDGEVLGFSLTTEDEHGHVFQGWFYPHENLIRVNLNGKTLINVAPISDMLHTRQKALQ